MAEKVYTVMVMGGASSRIKRFSVRKGFIKWLGISGASFFLIGAFFIYNYSVMLERLNNVKPIEKEKTIVITKVDDFRLRRLTHSLDAIKRNLQDMQKVSTKFRVMVGLQQDLDKHQFSGIGGNEDPFKKASVFRGNKLLDEMLKDIENMKIGISKQKGRMSELMNCFMLWKIGVTSLHLRLRFGPSEVGLPRLLVCGFHLLQKNVSFTGVWIYLCLREALLELRLTEL